MSRKKSSGRIVNLPDMLWKSLQITAPDIPEPEREYPFAYDIVGRGRGIRARLSDARLKAWRLDLAWPEVMLAAECEGGAFVHGRHTRGKGFGQDLIKYSHAMAHGWTMIDNGLAMIHIEKIYRRLVLIQTPPV